MSTPRQNASSRWNESSNAANRAPSSSRDPQQSTGGRDATQLDEMSMNDDDMDIIERSTQVRLGSSKISGGERNNFV